MIFSELDIVPIASDIPYAGIFLTALLVPSNGSTTKTTSDGVSPSLSSPISSLTSVKGLPVLSKISITFSSASKSINLVGVPSAPILTVFPAFFWPTSGEITSLTSSMIS